MTLHFVKDNNTEEYIRNEIEKELGRDYKRFEGDTLVTGLINRLTELKATMYRLVICKSENNITANLYATSQNSKVGSLVYVWNSGFKIK